MVSDCLWDVIKIFDMGEEGGGIHRGGQIWSANLRCSDGWMWKDPPRVERLMSGGVCSGSPRVLGTTSETRLFNPVTARWRSSTHSCSFLLRKLLKWKICSLFFILFVVKLNFATRAALKLKTEWNSARISNIFKMQNAPTYMMFCVLPLDNLPSDDVMGRGQFTSRRLRTSFRLTVNFRTVEELN